MSGQDDFDGAMLDRKLDAAIAMENAAARDMVVEVVFADKSRHNFTLKATEDGNYEGFVFRMKFRFEWTPGKDDEEGREIEPGFWEAYPLLPVGSGETDVRDRICWGTGEALDEAVKDVCRTRGLVAPKEPTGEGTTEVQDDELTRLYEAIDLAIERCEGFGTATGKVTDIHKILKAVRDER